MEGYSGSSHVVVILFGLRSSGIIVDAEMS